MPQPLDILERLRQVMPRSNLSGSLVALVRDPIVSLGVLNAAIHTITVIVDKANVGVAATGRRSSVSSQPHKVSVCGIFGGRCPIAHR